MGGTVQGCVFARGWNPGRYVGTTVQATDRVVALFGHDVFGNLVTQAGWSLPEYKAWLYTTLVQQLLQQPARTLTAFSDLLQPPDHGLAPFTTPDSDG